MERKVGVSHNSVFPGGFNWFKIDLSHQWGDFWISAFGEKRSTQVLQVIYLKKCCQGS